ncbi:hypothetical protein HAX54_041309 [Datura stramonium]|uniref:Uncharacterized protein n=1 Tax=Datura stramonium TaxID=4076 RepID=A0ABS8VT98_DATST|nr:hypothetical protein [Datura stramonium]
MGTLFTRRFEADRIGGQSISRWLTYRTLPYGEDDDVQEPRGGFTESGSPKATIRIEYSGMIIVLGSEKAIESSLEMAELENVSPLEAEKWLISPCLSEILKEGSRATRKPSMLQMGSKCLTSADSVKRPAEKPSGSFPSYVRCSSRNNVRHLIQHSSPEKNLKDASGKHHKYQWRIRFSRKNRLTRILRTDACKSQGGILKVVVAIDLFLRIDQKRGPLRQQNVEAKKDSVKA